MKAQVTDVRGLSWMLKTKAVGERGDRWESDGIFVAKLWNAKTGRIEEVDKNRKRNSHPRTVTGTLY